MWKISVVFILVAASGTFFITSSVYQQSSKENEQRTFFDASKNLHIMGVVLGKSTLRDAEIAFRSRSDSAIFLYPKPTEEGSEPRYTGKLEAYFPSIADHSKVVLTLNITPSKLETMRQRASKPRIYPNGVIRMNLSSKDILAVQKMTATKLTLIPSLQLDESMVYAQFGQPESINKETATITHFMYPKIGLIATINLEEKDQLTFTNTP
ncbi:MAG: hypothetical protein Q9M44_04110 [Ghiorsea sp.]|nr:hypothetical protein [Ghiorsea sp.]